MEDRSSLMSCMMLFTLRRMPLKFRIDIFMGSLSRMGGQEGLYLEDIVQLGSPHFSYKNGHKHLSGVI